MQKNTKIFLGASLAAVLFLAAASALLISTLIEVPDFKRLKDYVDVPIRLADGTKSTRRVGPHAAGWVPISKVSNHLLMAVIASEDTSFYSHKGVDFYELKESIKKDLKEKRWARGASTLTQQLIKNVYLSPEKTLSRKVKEILWAREIEKVFTKAQILQFYVNMAEWGPGIYGILEASRHYFGVSPAELTPKQAAFLAMLLPSPVKYHVYYSRRSLTPWSSGRVNRILSIMKSMGFIDESSYEVALGESLWGETPSSSDTLPDLEPSEDPNLPMDPSLPPADSSPMVPDNSESPESLETPPN